MPLIRNSFFIQRENIYYSQTFKKKNRLVTLDERVDLNCHIHKYIPLMSEVPKSRHDPKFHPKTLGYRFFQDSQISLAKRFCRGPSLRQQDRYFAAHYILGTQAFIINVKENKHKTFVRQKAI